MLRVSSRILLCGVLLLTLQPASAWAPETRVRMIDEAVRFMPSSLRLALERHREALLRGALAPMAHEDDAEHRAPWAGGTLDATVQARAAGLTEALAVQTPFAELAEQFGTLAHYVLDAGFPPGVGDGGESRYAHFAGFCESRAERFPLVFYGHAEPTLARGDFRAFAASVMERAREEDRQLALAYSSADDGNQPADFVFDDRSIPFAVASLSYSKSINDVVRAWLTVWERAQGDMGRTPYRQQERP